jgi:N-acetylglucosamine malate deacetylase 2
MKVLIFVAHPDDETMFAGGTIAMLTRSGANVHIVCATRGEGGEDGEPPLCARDELGAVRSSELICAANALGCSGVEFLPFRDPDVQPDGTLGAFANSTEEVASRLTDCLKSDSYDALFTHGTDGEYGHPGHTQANRAGMLAGRAAGVSAAFTFGANFPDHPRPRSANRSDPAEVIVDIAPSFELKLAAAECHRTQRALFVRRPSAEAGHPVLLRDALLRVESFRRVWGEDSLEIVQWMKSIHSVANFH